MLNVKYSSSIFIVFFIAIVNTNAQTLNPQQVKDVLTKVFETEGYNKIFVTTRFFQARTQPANGDFQAMSDVGLLEQVQLDLTTMWVSGQEHTYVTAYQPVRNPLVLSWENDKTAGGRGELSFVAITGAAVFEKVTVFPQTDYSGNFVIKYKINELSQFAKYCTKEAVNIGSFTEVRAPYAVSTDGVEVDWENFKKAGIFGSRSIQGITENASLQSFAVQEKEKAIQNFKEFPSIKPLIYKIADKNICADCFVLVNKTKQDSVELTFNNMPIPFMDKVSAKIVNDVLAINIGSMVEIHAFFSGTELILAYKYKKGTSFLDKLAETAMSTLIPDRSEYQSAYTFLPQYEADKKQQEIEAQRQATLPEAYKRLAAIDFNYKSANLTFSYPNANLGKIGTVKYTFANGCQTCDTTEVKIFLSQIFSKIGKNRRMAYKAVEGAVPVSYIINVIAVDYSTTVYPELEIKVEYQLFDSKGKKVSTMPQIYKAYQMEGTVSKEELFVRVIESMDDDLERDVYELIPIEASVVGLGEPNSKGEIDEVYLGGSMPELIERNFDAYILSENDVHVENGVLKISKIFLKGKVKPADITPQGTKVRLKGKSKDIKGIFESGTKLFVVVSTNLN